jgi:hypothetical protein
MKFKNYMIYAVLSISISFNAQTLELKNKQANNVFTQIARNQIAFDRREIPNHFVQINKVKKELHFALHANLAGSNDFEFPNFILEYGKIEDHSNHYQRIYGSIGTAYLYGGTKKFSGNGITLKMGSQIGFFEYNFGFWFPQNGEEMSASLACNLGIRNPGKKTRFFCRAGVGWPELLYYGGGIKF